MVHPLLQLLLAISFSFSTHALPQGNLIGTGSDLNLTAASLTAWPPVPFHMTLGPDLPFFPIMFVVFRRVSRSGSRTDRLRFDTLCDDTIEKFRERGGMLIPGPRYINMTKSAGGPWLGCRGSGDGNPPRPMEAPEWSNLLSQVLLATLKEGVVGNGFREFDFTLGEKRKRAIADCLMRLRYEAGFLPEGIGEEEKAEAAKVDVS